MHGQNHIKQKLKLYNFFLSRTASDCPQVLSHYKEEKISLEMVGGFMLLMYDAYSMRYLRTMQTSSSYTDLTLSLVRFRPSSAALLLIHFQLLRPQSSVPASHLPLHGHLSWSYCPPPSLRSHCPPPTPLQANSHLSSSLGLINYSTCHPPHTTYAT